MHLLHGNCGNHRAKQSESCNSVTFSKVCFLFFFLVKYYFFSFPFIFLLLYFTLQYCIGFAIHQHESTTGIRKSPPSGTFLPPFLFNLRIGNHSVSWVLDQNYTVPLEVFNIWTLQNVFIFQCLFCKCSQNIICKLVVYKEYRFKPCWYSSISFSGCFLILRRS